MWCFESPPNPSASRVSAPLSRTHSLTKIVRPETEKKFCTAFSGNDKCNLFFNGESAWRGQSWNLFTWNICTRVYGSAAVMVVSLQMLRNHDMTTTLSAVSSLLQKTPTVKALPGTTHRRCLKSATHPTRHKTETPHHPRVWLTSPRPSRASSAWEMTKKWPLNCYPLKDLLTATVTEARNSLIHKMPVEMCFSGTFEVTDTKLMCQLVHQ